MKEIITKPLFIICSIIFLLHQLLQKVLAVSMPAIDKYLDNLVAMPIILSVFLLERRFFFSKKYLLKPLEIIAVTIYISLVSEFIFPRFSDKFKYDPIDFLLFGIGSLIFYLTYKHNENMPEVSSTKM